MLTIVVSFFLICCIQLVIFGFIYINLSDRFLIRDFVSGSLRLLPLHRVFANEKVFLAESLQEIVDKTEQLMSLEAQARRQLGGGGRQKDRTTSGIG